MSEQNIKWSIGDVFLFRTQDKYLGLMKEKTIIGKITDIVPHEYNHGYKYIYKSLMTCDYFTKFKLDFSDLNWQLGFYQGSNIDRYAKLIPPEQVYNLINKMKAEAL